MNIPTPSKLLPRIGFHYYPDTFHYRKSDLDTWIPALKALGASWLTIEAPINRAIPETFISRLLAEGIQPILRQNLLLDPTPPITELAPILRAYANWGIKYMVFFDRPNQRSAWPVTLWAEKSLVERFLDIYIPIANTAYEFGLIPVFPPLEPGGDYWDTAFIRMTAQGLKRRNAIPQQDPWIMSCYAEASNRSLDWGAGGPEQWPGSRPYGNPSNEQDQCGFRIYEWYLALANAELQQPCEIFLFRAGCKPGDQADLNAPAINEVSHAWQNIEIAKRLCNSSENIKIRSEVKACNFWLLTTTSDCPYASDSWFPPNGKALPVVSAFHQWKNTITS